MVFLGWQKDILSSDQTELGNYFIELKSGQAMIDPIGNPAGTMQKINDQRATKNGYLSESC